MKKIFFLIICFIIFSPITKAFLGENLGINLYKNINEGIDELELKQYEYELSGQGESIKDYFNEILDLNGYLDCLENDLTSDEVNKISAGNIELLYSKISGKCLDKDGNISTIGINNIQQIIKNINQTTKEKAIQKTIQLNNISKIGIYSDGNTQNSPFDLIEDLQNIDYYIFTEEIPYNGEVLANNDDLINSSLGINNKNLNKGNVLNSSNYINLLNPNNSSISTNPDLYNNQNSNLDSNGNPIIENSYKCIDSTINSELSGLSQEEIDKLINYSNNNSTNNEIDSEKNELSNNNLNNGSSGLIEASNNEKGEYKKLNDNGIYPCTTFFCITIDFITYQHNLFGGGNNISIEYLVNRSNTHLKKFAATSLTQSEMTSNNWEFGLKDLNLPDIFHVGFIITKKPVPILDIRLDETKKDNTQYSKDNLLEKYYKNFGLEYSRKNDIKNFEGNYDELKTVLDLAELGIGETSNKMEELNQINQEKLKENDFVSKDVFKKVTNDDGNDFEKRFIELNKFSNSIKNYIDELNNIIIFMSKIPIDKG